ncbi:MAG: hypothetical protein LBF70_01140 [Holosporales bacterium]|nr:hypothetical protein [Holosporales bacterium]
MFFLIYVKIILKTELMISEIRLWIEDCVGFGETSLMCLYSVLCISKLVPDSGSFINRILPEMAMKQR